MADGPGWLMQSSGIIGLGPAWLHPGCDSSFCCFALDLPMSWVRSTQDIGMTCLCPEFGQTRDIGKPESTKA
eukprot:scaffold6057_cov66-Attheya_sp.AAC.4